MDEYLISVIVPIYNVDKFLNKCIKSIINQTYKKIEIILIDDGSTDTSSEICDNYAKLDTRIFVFHKTNGGVSSARNLGIKNAKGEYLCFIDSDDYIECDHIEKMMREIGSADIIICKYTIQDNSKKYVPFSKEHINREYLNDDKKFQIVNKLLLEGIKHNFEIKTPIMPVWKNLYKTSLIIDNEIVFDSEREIYAEDFIFNVKLYTLAKSIKVSDIATYIHFLNYNSLSKSYKKNFYAMSKKRYALTHEFLLKSG